MPTTSLKPIQTRYRGHHFRSRLEARYAVFLDCLGVQWQYEPEGFELPAGNYLPDFFLPAVNGGTWLEIKPHGGGSFFGFCSDRRPSSSKNPGRLVDDRLGEFAEAAQTKGQNFYVAYGIPSSDYLAEDAPDYDEEGMLENPWDSHQWSVCSCGKTPGIQFDARSDRNNCPHNCAKSYHGDKGYSHDHPLIIEAAFSARAARFEHGECGAT